MNRFLKNIYLHIFIIFIATQNINYGQILNSFAKIETSGIVDVIANNPSTSEKVNWVITCCFIDENDLSFQDSPDTTYLSGDSVRILLTKKVGKYTYFKVFARNQTFSDSASFQVMNKGIPEKYLFHYKSIPTKPIVVYLIIPDDIQNADFTMVLTGTDRNSLDYAKAWRTFSKQNNYFIATPTFTKEDWSTNAYNLGNMFSSTNYNHLNADSLWAFTLISKLHDELVDALGIKKKSYNLWGHSAGAQFVHRLMTFKPDYKVDYAICGNAGWYTVPDLEIDFPFGLQNDNLSYDETFLEDLVIKNIIVMRGTADTLRDSNLNTSAGADAQGFNRFERAENYFGYASKIASTNKWKLIDVPNVGHDYILMAAAAQKFLLDVTDVTNLIQNIPTNFELSQNYPNPFNPTTQIIFRLKSSEYVTLKVFDILGKEILTLVNETKQAGTYKVNFNAKNLSNGVYLYRIKAGKFTETKKMILLK
ncbi:MAG: hypothetical protein COW71_03545 [Ignavibacteriales bacterium CG18_big_fil_WC_8_21_14_2_50_31_20]|nr:MAG: hypothetical protein COW71_03545 [Ignavibacteriales bacterium CG18_big_fil_WC_8_21_14_2_50_31_20]